MPKRALRILIVDEQLIKRVLIEKQFNQLGYFRIAPFESFEDLLAIAEFAIEPFDLLVISNTLTTTRSFSVADFCRGCAKVRHVLIYDCLTSTLAQSATRALSRQIKQVGGLPDDETIRAFLRLIDPQSGTPLLSHRRVPRLL